MTKREKVKNFVKENKGLIIAYSVYGALAGIGASHIVECIQNAIKASKMQKNTDRIDIPNLTIKDFGKVGEEVISTIDEVTKDTPVKGWSIYY